ncbi:MAG: DUF4838 domain-containing protein [Bryobacteraceae bacterium]|nr:DUF4838 domain-containing protein [Bryobacteraceae bacterium]
MRHSFWILSWAIALAGGAASQSYIVENGRSSYTIVTPAKPAPPEAFAAQELQKYVRKVTGAELPIDTAGRSPAILLGKPNDAVRKLLENRRPDSYALRREGRDLHLAGNTPAGTLYAVYHLLEKYAGCSWLQPGDEVVPRRAELGLPDYLQEVEEPKFDYRNLNLYPFIADRNLRNADWAAKSRLNWVHACTNSSTLWEDFDSRRTLAPELAKRGIHLNYGGHTFNTWVSPKTYYKDHPDYFSLVNGKRDPAQLCVSNPAVARVAAENISSFLDRNPEVEMVDLWLNDVTRWCECDGCRQMEGKERKSILRDGNSFQTRTNSNIKFVNAVAREVGKRHPKVLLQTLAYFMVIDAPEVAPEKNIVVGFAPIDRVPPQSAAEFKQEPAGYWYPLYLADHDVNRRHKTELEKWLRILPADRFFTYEYYSQWNTARSMININTEARDLETRLLDPSRKMFRVFTDAMAKDIAYYVQIGMKNISTEEWDWNELNMYAYPRLLWHPEFSSNAIISDYCARAYGQAAAPMRKHWLILQETKERYPAWKAECMALVKQATAMTKDANELRRIRVVEEMWLRVK